MCFDICTINIRVSIRVRGLHLVSPLLNFLLRMQEALCILECGVMPATLAYLQTGVQARFVLTINPLTGLVFQRGNTQVPAKKATRARKEAGLQNTTKLL